MRSIPRQAASRGTHGWDAAFPTPPPPRTAGNGSLGPKSGSPGGGSPEPSPPRAGVTHPGAPGVAGARRGGLSAPPGALQPARSQRRGAGRRRSGGGSAEAGASPPSPPLGFLPGQVRRRKFHRQKQAAGREKEEITGKSSRDAQEDSRYLRDASRTGKKKKKKKKRD